MVELRSQLTADGLDAGPHTIGWHLEQEGQKPPAPATISRILKQAGLVSLQPRKRPRSSYTRFEMAQPNEMWQSDFIHWRLLDGTDVEILNWLDDHSRYLLACTAHQPVTGDDVVKMFLETVDKHGPPAATLTDNGSVYTSRFTGGRNAFEYLLPLLGARQKNGSPGHPQTQGKTERFHQTLAEVVRAAGAADAYLAFGVEPVVAQAVIGTKHARKRVLALADEQRITVIELDTGEVLSTHLIQPNKAYWRNTQREPGRWPSPPN